MGKWKESHNETKENEGKMKRVQRRKVKRKTGRNRVSDKKN